MPELKFTACPTETRADSGFSEPDPNFPKPENPNAQPWQPVSAAQRNRGGAAGFEGKKMKFDDDEYKNDW